MSRDQSAFTEFLDEGEDDPLALVDAARQKLAQPSQRPSRKPRSRKAASAQAAARSVAAQQPEARAKSKPKAKPKPKQKTGAKAPAGKARRVARGSGGGGARARKGGGAAAPGPTASDSGRASGFVSLGQGLITRGVGAGLRGIEAVAAGGRGLGLHGVIAGGALFVVLMLSYIGWRERPAQPPLSAVRFVDAPAPKVLKDRWVTSFPDFRLLYLRPDDAVLDRFAAHLASQPGVAAVDEVALEWQTDAHGHSRRVAAVRLQLREAMLPLRLASGRRAWVDAQGAVLPGQLPGPQDVPVVLHLERAGPAGLREIAAVWPELRATLPRGYLRAIDLDAAFPGRPDQRGIVFHASDGTMIVWGRPGEGCYGVTPQEKVHNLAHSVRHFEQVAAINVRFPEPVAMVD
ncbi:MAG: hypothetical protein ACOCYP_02555 [Planctomycetota bacterium]